MDTIVSPDESNGTVAMQAVLQKAHTARLQQLSLADSQVRASRPSMRFMDSFGLPIRQIRQAALIEGRVAARPTAFASFAVSSAVALSVWATPTLARDQFDGVRDLIRAEMTQEDIPSVAVVVARHGKILWEKGFGWADKEALIAATPDTMYRIASITKPLTATALMQLVEVGKVNLDESVNDYLGEVKLVARVGDIREATVRRIANHTAELPTHWQYCFGANPYLFTIRCGG